MRAGHDSNRAAPFQDANPAACKRLIVRLSLYLPENFPASSFNSSLRLVVVSCPVRLLDRSALFFFFYILPAEIIKMVSPLVPAPPPPALLSLEVSGGQGGSGASPPSRAGSRPPGRDCVTRLAAMIDTPGLVRPLWLDIRGFTVGPHRGHQPPVRYSFGNGNADPTAPFSGLELPLCEPVSNFFVPDPSHSKRRRNPQKGHCEAICPLLRAGEMTNNRREGEAPLEKRWLTLQPSPRGNGPVKVNRASFHARCLKLAIRKWKCWWAASRVRSFSSLRNQSRKTSAFYANRFNSVGLWYVGSIPNWI